MVNNKVFNICKLGFYSYVNRNFGQSLLDATCKKAIENRSMVVMDLETSGLSPILDSIRLIAFTVDGTHAIVFNPDETDTYWFQTLLKSNKISNHNIGFDYSFIKKRYDIDFEIEYDTYIMHALAFTGIGHYVGGSSLQNLSEKYLGIKLSKELRKTFITDDWDTPENIQYAAEDVLSTWALIPIVTTFLKHSEMYSLWETIERPFIKVLCDMKLDGVNFDKEAALVLRDKLFLELEDLLKKIDDATKYEDDVTTKCKECRGRGVLPKRLGGAQCTECNGVGTITRRETIHINPGSSKQLINFFARNNVEVPMLERKDGTTSASVGVIARRRINHPVIQLLDEYAKINKKLTGFLIPLTTSTAVDKENGVFNHITNCIHTNYTQVATDTGRLSSTGPNLQNIPREAEFRHLFIPPPGEVFVTSDMAQYEVRVLAELSGDVVLRKLFLDREREVQELEYELEQVREVLYTPELGVKYPKLHELYRKMSKFDFHGNTAISIFKLDPETIDYESTEWKTLRSRAKTISFAIPYGSGARGIASAAQIPVKEAEKNLRAYFDTYKSVEAWLKLMRDSVRFPDTSGLSKKLGLDMPLVWSSTIGGRRRYYLFPVTQDEEEKKKLLGDIGRKACNQPIQGVNADVIKQAANTLRDLWNTPKFKGTVLRLSVHDEIVSSCPKHLAKDVARAQIKAMKSASEKYLKTIPTEVSTVITPHWEKG